MCWKTGVSLVIVLCTLTRCPAARQDLSADPQVVLDPHLPMLTDGETPHQVLPPLAVDTASSPPNRTLSTPLHVYTAMPVTYPQLTVGEVISTLAIFLFGAVMFAAPTYLSIQLRLDWKRSSGLWFSLATLILTCAVLLLMAEYAGQQLAIVSGLFGATAGYVLGALSRHKNAPA